MRRVAFAVTAVAMFTAPAFAQFNMGGGGGQERDKTRYSEEQRRTEAEVERAYKEAVKNTRGAASETYDPWRNIRPGNEPVSKKPAR
jgi:hypothetical protein